MKKEPKFETETMPPGANPVMEDHAKIMAVLVKKGVTQDVAAQVASDLVRSQAYRECIWVKAPPWPTPARPARRSTRTARGKRSA